MFFRGSCTGSPPPRALAGIVDRGVHIQRLFGAPPWRTADAACGRPAGTGGCPAMVFSEVPEFSFSRHHHGGAVQDCPPIRCRWDANHCCPKGYGPGSQPSMLPPLCSSVCSFRRSSSIFSSSSSVSSGNPRSAGRQWSVSDPRWGGSTSHSLRSSRGRARS